MGEGNPRCDSRESKTGNAAKYEASGILFMDISRGNGAIPVTVPVNKDRETFTMPARVHDESVMEPAAKVDDFSPSSPPRGGELGESQARERNNGAGERAGER